MDTSDLTLEEHRQIEDCVVAARNPVTATPLQTGVAKLTAMIAELMALVEKSDASERK